MARLTRRTLLGTATLALAAPMLARAQARTIKIGVLNDQSSLYADNTGQGSVLGARMAVEEMGGRVGNMPWRSCSPTTRTAPMSARRSRGNGTTATV